MTKAVTHGMPPLSRTSFKPDELAETTLDRFLETLAKAELPAEAAAAVKTLQSMTSEQRHTVVKNVLNETIEQDRIAQHVLVLAGLQVHFTRLAANDQSALICADGIAHMRQPASRELRGQLAGRHEHALLHLLALRDMWYVVRVKCLLCGSKGINFRLIEGQPDTIKAETCDKCHGYVRSSTRSKTRRPSRWRMTSFARPRHTAERKWLVPRWV